MNIQGIKSLAFEQYAFHEPILKDNLQEKCISKDFILELGDVKIKLKSTDSLKDIIRKINLKTYNTGIYAKTIKGNLVLECITITNSHRTAITLPRKYLGELVTVDANQIIADYLASLSPKINTEIQVEIATNHEAIQANISDDIISSDESFQEVNDDISSQENLISNANDILHSLNEEANNSISSQENLISNANDILSSSNEENEGLSPNNNTGSIQAPNNPNSQSTVIIPQNLATAINNLATNNCMDYWNSLKNTERATIELAINAKINSFNNASIPKPPSSAPMTDKFFFCIKQINTKKMAPFRFAN